MENFTEDLRYQYDLTPESVVLDCGGYEGRFAAGIYDRYGCTVHVLEPVKHFYDGIVLRFGADHPKVRVHNIGIGSTCRTDRFSIKGDMTGPYADNPETESVSIVGVDRLFSVLGLWLIGVDVMKLNIEGGEFETIEALMDGKMINNVRNIQVQWHSVVPDYQARYDALQAKLAQTHHLTFDHGWVWQNWARNA